MKRLFGVLPILLVVMFLATTVYASTLVAWPWYPIKCKDTAEWDCTLGYARLTLINFDYTSHTGYIDWYNFNDRKIETDNFTIPARTGNGYGFVWKDRLDSGAKQVAYAKAYVTDDPDAHVYRYGNYPYTFDELGMDHVSGFCSDPQKETVTVTGTDKTPGGGTHYVSVVFEDNWGTQTVKTLGVPDNGSNSVSHTVDSAGDYFDVIYVLNSTPNLLDIVEFSADSTCN